MNKEKIKKIDEEFEKVFGNETHFNGDVEMNDVKGFFYNKLEEIEKEAEERFNLGKLFMLEKMIEDIKREERERIISIINKNKVDKDWKEFKFINKFLDEIIENINK